ncbi:hypothetical protein DSO57_1001020 [Entomophthora muscae]|uniref:Uncharacterized protein n=2 Tax=Entomophthora muscae TaxID=34485 RepID=A0ACC2UVP8_9FUNG|nr:hypothetical protein DSO57_1001020 [Entomophthora muscae]
MRFLFAGANIGATVCTPCQVAHRKCSRGVPTFNRCLKKGLQCVRTHAPSDNIVILKRWRLKPTQAVPRTWEQVMYFSSMPLLTRFFFRRYVMPMVLIFPKPTVAHIVNDLRKKAMSPYIHPLKPKTTVSNCDVTSIQDTFVLAIKAFFLLYNPFYPLFSEEGFYLKPRSPTLLKIVIQVGLERMPQSDLTRSAKRKNNLTPDDFNNLPVSLDSLQCLILGLFAVWIPGLEAFRMTRPFMINSMIYALGLHAISPSSPFWFEATLAKHAAHLGFHHQSIGQYLTRCKFISLYKNDFFLRSPFPADMIHLITSQALYNSFTILVNASRAYTLALNNKTQSKLFLEEVVSFSKLLRDNLAWAWNQLAALNAQNKTLLTQSRLVLALRCHNDTIELAKLSLHIPPNRQGCVSHVPITTDTCLTTYALSIATRNIHLVSTVNPHAFNSEYVRILIPSIAYIMFHLKHEATNPHLCHALTQAKACLEKGREVPTLKVSAKCYLELIEFLLSFKK